MSARQPTPDQQRELLRQMLLIRKMEQQLHKDFHDGKLPGGVHLYIGQEAVAAGVCAHLDDRDWIASTHRGHGHFLAKGGDPKRMLAEVHAKATGICQGMGGSMHVADFSKGIIGANGIVAGGIAITTGAGFAAYLDKQSRVAVCFFGDGAANQGVLMESLNVSTLWKLPVIFVCEHNGWSEFSESSTVTAGEIADRARAFKIPTHVIDGNNVLEVWSVAAEVIEHARAGNGPAFIEAKTYRTFGHNESEIHWLSTAYREDADIEPWRQKDPIDRLANHVRTEGICSDADLEALDRDIDAVVAKAVAFTAESLPPEPALLDDMMFAGQRP